VSSRRRTKLVATLGDVLLTLASIGGALCIALVIAANLFQVSLIMFKTGSMAPAIPTGSLAIVREIPASEVQIGDVVTVDRGEGLLPITHRVVTTSPGADGLVTLTLKGDANAAIDPAPYDVSKVRIVLASIPGLAYAVAAFSSPGVLGITSLLVSVLVTAAFWPRRAATVVAPPAAEPAVEPSTEPRRRGRRGRRARRAAPPRRRAHASGPRRARRSSRRRDPARQRARHAAGRVAAVLGVLVAMTALPMSLPSAPANAAVVEEVITGEHLILTSIRDPEAMTDMLPGQPVEWQLGIAVSSAEPGMVDLTLRVDGTLAADPTGLWLDVQQCDVRWTVDGCATGATTVTALRPASEIAGSTYALGSMPSSEARWYLIRGQLLPEPAIVSDGYAELSVLAVGLGEAIGVDGFGGATIGATGVDAVPPLVAAGASILLGLALALAARIARRRPA
jgi:signal peptidase